MFSTATDLAILFAASFLAATLLPAQSEAALTGLMLTDRHHMATLVLVATFGNVLGACINWVLGRYILYFGDKPWFPVKQEALMRATEKFQRYGVWTLLLAWVPIVGDPLTIIAGIMRTNFVLFLILVTIGKTGRYIAIALAVSAV